MRTPTSAAFGDLDGDGVLDAVVSGNLGADFPASSEVAVLLGRGGGVFGPPAAYEPGPEATFVALADLDGDGHLDVLVCNASGDTVGVLRGLGDGTIGAQVEFETGDEPRSLVAEDLDGDGDVDVAALNTLSSDISVLLNNGDGTLAAQSRIPIEFVTPRGDPNRNFAFPGPYLAAGDLDGDIDLAVPAIDRVHLLLNDGAGGFTDAPAHPVSPRRFVYNVKLADLNGDGAIDIAASIATGGLSRMVVWLNHGGGSFPQADEYDSSWLGDGAFYFNTGLAIGDYDSDGTPDIGVSSEFIWGIPIHHNLGDGTFGEAEVLPTFWNSWFIDAPDLNADGHDDLTILSSHIRGALRSRLNDGEGSLIGPLAMPVGVPMDGNTSRHAISAADLDGDGDVDLAVGVRQTPHILRRIELLENDGTGSFDRTGEIILDDDGESAVEALLAVDLNNDGLPEILAADAVENAGHAAPGVLWLLANEGDLQFQQRELFRFDDAYALRLDAADMDGDGLIDVIAWVHGVFEGNNQLPAERTVVIFRNLGGLEFEAVAQLDVADMRWDPNGDVAVGDVDGDGDLDIAATTGTGTGPGEVVVFLNDGGWSFTELARATVSPRPRGVVIGDFNGDGRGEVAVLQNPTDQSDGTLPFLYAFRVGDAELQLIQEHTTPLDYPATRLRSYDMDRDSLLDLIWGASTGRIYVALGRGDGTFDPPVGYDTLHSAFAVEVADFDGDGRLDYASTSIGTEAVSIQYNRACYTPCPADLTGSADPDDPTYGIPDHDVDAEDFFYYLDLFAAGDDRADIDQDGDIDAEDFFAYLDLFAAGC